MTRIGRDGGDASDADAVLAAVPSGSIAEALDKVRGLDGKVTLDATNQQRVPPSVLFAAEDGAREAAERLARDAGFDPVSVGGLEQARALEDQAMPAIGIAQTGLGWFFYRYAKPGQL